MTTVYWVLSVCWGLDPSQSLFYLIHTSKVIIIICILEMKACGWKQLHSWWTTKLEFGGWGASWFQSLHHTAQSDLIYSKILRHVIHLTMISFISHIYICCNPFSSLQMDLGWLKKDIKCKNPLTITTYVLISLYYWQRIWNKVSSVTYPRSQN